MRLFFAFMPMPKVADEIARVAAEVQSNAVGRLVARSNLHATLAFLGEVPEAQLAGLRSFARRQGAADFDLAFDHLEFWPKAAAIVLTADKVPFNLQEFSSRFQVGLSLPGGEPFRPHVTLVRKVTQRPVLPAIDVVRWKPYAFSLVQSDTGGVQSAYTVLDTWPLLYEH